MADEVKKNDTIKVGLHSSFYTNFYTN